MSDDLDPLSKILRYEVLVLYREIVFTYQYSHTTARDAMLWHRRCDVYDYLL